MYSSTLLAELAELAGPQGQIVSLGIDPHLARWANQRTLNAACGLCGA